MGSKVRDSRESWPGTDPFRVMGKVDYRRDSFQFSFFAWKVWKIPLKKRYLFQLRRMKFSKLYLFLFRFITELRKRLSNCGWNYTKVFLSRVSRDNNIIIITSSDHVSKGCKRTNLLYLSVSIEAYVLFIIITALPLSFFVKRICNELFIRACITKLLWLIFR